ncbi:MULTISPECIES: TRAP transporter large permease [unclassified Microbacterium]|uniref:TRAP transporter large permease n=1 Tax=unclassified Microbacterium TaxID=2609290 RepID=UPI00214AD2C8|nr:MULTISPECIES: TRAP transporter large permease [unclassified Microbacterium]MCR2785939.1 TRAP transporter large permease [Microbacterium sp. zg.B96]MDL5353167.1 TRAP transporter large permease [Microbacterium sp. zg-YB36]WIM17087.1 TRAP transporter large permease [Microbacterium sp. zg-B96]
MELWLYIVVLVVFLLLRVPVAFAMIAASMLYFYTQGLSPGYAMSSIVNGINSFPLLAVPLFIFVGTVANHLGIATRLYDFARALLPRLPGNLAYVNLATAIGFSWISGSALADAASTSKVQIPQMLKAGYPYGFSAGLTASGSLMSTVMPPSIPAVLFAATATISTGALFAGSILPAMLMALGLAIYVFIWVKLHPAVAVSRSFDGAMLGKAVVRVLGPMMLPVIILGGIFSGWFTPTESAGIAAAYMLVLGVFYRTLTFKVFWRASKETVIISGGILLILGASNLMGQVLAREQVSRNLGEWLSNLTDNPVVFLLLLNVLLILLGIFLEAPPVILVLVPILMPIAASFGIDPVHLGVIMILNLMIGSLTPPVGAVLFVVGSITRRPMGELFRGILPFLIPLGVVLLLLTLFPAIVTIVPTWLGLM